MGRRILEDEETGTRTVDMQGMNLVIMEEHPKDTATYSRTTLSLSTTCSSGKVFSSYPC
jgi:hypothetical protein